MKSTDDLDEFLKSKNDIELFLQENKADLKPPSFTEQLTHFLNEKNMSRADIVRATLLQERYVYEIFGGTKKPGRDKVLQICLAFKLSVNEANHLLGSIGLNSLYSRDTRDAVIMFCLLNHKSVMACNELLFEKGMQIFE